MSILHPQHHRCPYHLRTQTSPAEMDLLVQALEMASPELDVFEIGTAYGGSAYFGARWAKQHNRRLWCIDQFGWPGALLPEEPSMEVTFAALRAEELHRWAVLVPGTTADVGAMFRDGCFGFGLIDGMHDREWGLKDGQFAQRVLSAGGLLAYHDLWADRRYEGLSEAVEVLVDRYGWAEVAKADSMVLYRLGDGCASS